MRHLVSTIFVVAMLFSTISCGSGNNLSVKDEQHTGETKAGSNKVPERKQIPDKYKWNLKEIYASDNLVDKDEKTFKEMLEKGKAYKGKLGNGTGVVKECLDTFDKASQLLEKMWVYSHLKSDEDTRVDKYRAMADRCQTLEGELGKASAFVDPELLALNPKKLEAYANAPELKDYDRKLHELIRRRKHILSPEAEAILAGLSPVASSGMRIYETFSGAEIPFPEVKIDGKMVKLSQQRYVQYRVNKDRNIRRRVFEAFWNTYKKFQKSMASMLYSQILAYVSYAKDHHYDSALDAKLDEDAIPKAVLDNLFKAIHEGLPIFQRYLKLKKRALGLKDLAYYDIYSPLTKGSTAHYTLDKAREIVLSALAPMGSEYLSVFKKAIADGSGRVDYMPNAGKRSGAYCSSGVYGQHPYVLMNFNGDYESMSTLAHEMGHFMHSYFSNTNQPHPKADYVIFVAEVASTVNETLLIEHVLKQIKDPREKLALIGDYLEGFRGTVFRQTMFAEFEEELYKTVEQGKGLTSDQISKEYFQLLKKYHGADKGVMHLDDLYSVEWAYIPHFYYDHYVFTYATGLIAATALAERIRTMGPEARDAYINSLLKGGNSKDPVELLKGAGVDMTSPEPYKAALAVFERRISEAEALLTKLGR
ncbi:MAG: oligoendopeptidase F [Deltaproteobacteria bacterium]|nr:oligoendopeptidase F [Deltaproteobacteria bacterium]